MIRSTHGRWLSLLLVAPVALVACDRPANHPAAAGASSSIAASPSSSPTPSPAPSSAPVVKPKVSKAALDQLFAVALGTTYGDKTSRFLVWSQSAVTVRVHGADAKSTACVNQVITDINRLTVTTDLRVSKNPSDIELHITPVSTMKSIIPSYVSGNDSYTNVRWADLYAVTGATAVVRSTGISAASRCHHIRLALAMALGILRNSRKDRASIFCDRPRSRATKFSALDRDVIRLLYSGAVHPGDDRKTVQAAVTVTG